MLSAHFLLAFHLQKHVNPHKSLSISMSAEHCNVTPNQSLKTCELLLVSGPDVERLTEAVAHGGWQ